MRAAELLSIIADAKKLIPESDMIFSPANSWHERADAVLSEKATPLARHVATRLFDAKLLRPFTHGDGVEVVGVAIDGAIEEFAAR